VLLSGLLACIKNTATKPLALRAFKTTQKTDINVLASELNPQRCFSSRELNSVSLDSKSSLIPLSRTLFFK
jgi:hypothetical protein